MWPHRLYFKKLPYIKDLIFHRFSVHRSTHIPSDIQEGQPSLRTGYYVAIGHLLQPAPHGSPKLTIIFLRLIQTGCESQSI